MDEFDGEPSILDGEDLLSEYDHADGDIVEDKDEDDEWYALPLDRKWEIIMRRLIDKEVRWDDDDVEDQREEVWDPRNTGRVLSPREMESLASIDPRDKHRPTVLHRLAVDFGTERFTALPHQTRLKIIEYLLQHRRTDSREDPVLTRAIAYDNLEFINFVSDNCPAYLPGLLDATDSEGKNCLHYIFKDHFPNAANHSRRVEWARLNGKSTKEKNLSVRTTMTTLACFVTHARPQCVSTRDNKNNTPVHYALDYKNCRVNIQKYSEIVSQLINKGDEVFKRKDNMSIQFNDQGESPYLFFERTRAEFLSKLEKRHQASTESNTAASVTKPVDKEAGSGAQDIRGSMGHHIAKGSKDILAHMDSRDTATKWKAGMSMVPTSLLGSKQKLKKDFIPDLEMEGSIYASPGYGLARNRTSGPSAQAVSELVENRNLEYTSTLEKASCSSRTDDPVAGKTQSITHNPKSEKQALRGSSTIPWEETEKSKAAAEKIRRLLKLHYIRSRPEMDAKQLLYGKDALDRNFYFDASHLNGRSPGEVAGLIRMLASPGGFEDTLSYVCVPALSHIPEDIARSGPTSQTYTANQGRQRESDSQDEKPKGRDSAVICFDELARAGVRNILHLVVEDMKSPPHTDAAIERAIRGEDSRVPKNRRREDGFEVEIWDWRKFDLDTDVIRFSAAKLTQVHLYWSGNQTVLKAWACNEGLPRLCQASDRNLTMVIIHWSPGFEGPQRCESLLADFKREVENRTSNMTPGITVHLKKLPSGKTAGDADDSHRGPLTPGAPRPPPDHSWIETMESFRKALMTVHAAFETDIKPERVKVALIDDGVDRTNLLTYNNRVEVTGVSYWTGSAGMAPQNPSWHQSTHGHGTIMASSIVRVNPWVFLYVMRIQDEVDVISRQDGGIRIRVESAARAIEDAIAAAVKIISISWTIRDLAHRDTKAYPEHEREGIKALKKAIDKAKEMNILMFCSASDDIHKKGIDTLPYSHASNYVFRIGAADAYGWSDRQTEDHNTIDWFFPGNQVADDFNPRSVRTDQLMYRDGSSVATALAAGLASLILYLVNVMKEHYRAEPKIANKYSEYADRLCQRNVMKKAFDNIITDDNYRDKKFLPVWDLFGKRADKILEDTRNKDAKWEILAELCTKLVA
ncbi:hypothetical protein VMCG_10053 [Cytospora schulzeri]|uniref:Peptidase S8/S53 domain-containing protein n=1 Tax=Cytospora schulzeri TaxID=448051 RepID=A0A423VCQ5_9PEZI|nr:hypothetical protein VMCG_10053 [Valsa malicola]